MFALLVLYCRLYCIVLHAQCGIGMNTGRPRRPAVGYGCNEGPRRARGQHDVDVRHTQWLGGRSGQRCFDPSL